MKKILTVLLIAVMAAGFVFAGISGKADMRFGYNFKTGTYGFDSSNSEVNFDLDLGSTAVAAGEGDIHAEVEGQVKVVFANESKGSKFFAVSSDYGFGLKVSADWTAKIVGNNWEIALKTQKYGAADLAKSAIDTYRKGTKNVFDEYTGFAWTAVSLNGNYVDSNKVGIEAKVYDNTIGLVFNGDRKVEKQSTSSDYNFERHDEYTTYSDFRAYFLTKEFNVNGATFQFGGNLTYGTGKKYTDGKIGLTYAASNGGLIEPTLSTYTNLTATKGSVSAKIGYAGDKFSGFLATDVELFNEDTEGTNAFEIAANAKYDFVAFDAYYVSNVELSQYNKKGDEDENKLTLSKYASAKLAFDFAKFDVPVTFAVTGKNLLWFTSGTNSGFGKGSEDPDFKFEVAYNGIIAAAAYFEINTVDFWEIGGSVAYSAAMFDVKVGAYYTKMGERFGDSKARFMPTAEISTSKLVPGAVLSVGYYSNTDNNKFDTSSLLNSEDNGKIEAKCVIAF